MKKFYILLVVLFVVNGAIGQSNKPSLSCLPQGITFSTQDQIDNFQTNYPNCTEIEGDVNITGNDITNLNGLSVLTSIGGYLSISFNDFLTSITGLNNLNSIGTDFQIVNNSALTSLTGLGNVTTIGGHFSFYSNNALTNLTGLDNLTSIGGDFFLSFNYNLTSIIALENLTSIGGNFDIYYCTVLTSLAGLDNLTSIGHKLSISNNYALTSLTGLDNLTSVGGNLIIRRNTVLTSLTGLDNIDAGTISDLLIENNNLLSNCAIQSICDYLANPYDSVSISYNATGCNSIAEVDSACSYLSTNENFNGNSLSVYPNPSSTNIIIETPIEGSLSILNLNGQQLITRQITEPKTILDINSLPKGIYFLRMTNEKTVQVGKVIKQ